MNTLHKTVCFSGSRKWTNSHIVKEILELLKESMPYIVVGDATGLDSIVANLAKSMGWVEGINLFIYKANWKQYGNSAGPIRNQQMVDEMKPNLLFAFPLPGCKGTIDMIHRCQKNNIKVVIND